MAGWSSEWRRSIRSLGRLFLRGLPAASAVALILISLFIMPAASEDVKQALSGASYDFVAGNLTPVDASIRWSASSGSPTSSSESTFRWTAPVVDSPTSATVKLSLDSPGGCSKEYSFEVLVQPKREPKISLTKGCLFNEPARIGDRVIYTYNVTNSGGMALTAVNLTDAADWGPACLPTYRSGDDGDGILDPGESWHYECLYTIPDPADYPMLHIMQSSAPQDKMQQIMKNLAALKTRLEIIMNNLRQASAQFDTGAARLQTGRAVHAGRAIAYYNYTIQVTGESLSLTYDSMGNLNRSVYLDPITGAVFTVRYNSRGAIASEELFFPPPGTREYLKIEYDMPAPGYRNITVVDYKSGFAMELILDAKGNILSKEYKIIPGYKPYEEKYRLRNTATVKALAPDGSVVKDSDSFTLEIYRPLPILEITKTADAAQTAPGGLINYTITYRNLGGADAHDVVLKETFNRSVTFVFSNPSPDSGTTDKWSIGDLPIGDDGTIRVQTRLDTLTEPGSEITNRVDMTCKEGCWAVSVLNTSVLGAALNITKTASADPIMAGEILTYTINYRNDGLKRQTNVTISDWLDRYVDFIDTTSSPQLVNGSVGDRLWWSRGVLDPGEAGTITIRARVKPKEVLPENSTMVTNIYRINSTQSAGMSGTLNTMVIHSLWIYKSTDKGSYNEDENITYIIKYGNSENHSAENVNVTDHLPEVDLLSVSPPPDHREGNNLTWEVGTLKEFERRSIQLSVHIPKRAKASFHEDSMVEGEGYAYVRRAHSTAEEKKSIVNVAEITGYYHIFLYRASATSSATLIGSAGTYLLSSEHGSGTYRESARSSMYQENKSVGLDRNLFASYHETTAGLVGDRSINFDSRWSDRTRVENRMLFDSLSEEYLYADTLNKSSSFQADLNQTVYSSEADLISGIARIKYTKHYSEGPGVIQQIDENYHGSFKIKESLDSYGESVKFEKSGKGKGFVSSDSSVTAKRRSYESGSGYYFSEEASQLGSVEKSTKMQYSPVQLSIGGVNMSFDSLWSEGMWSEEREKKLYLGEELRYATSVDREALMDSSRLSILGGFNGSQSIKLRSGRDIALEQVLVGSFEMDTAISVYSAPRHLYPHVSVNKRAVMEDEDIVLFIINVTNDGNKLLRPVNVTDMLPVGCNFINSSIRAKTKEGLVNWTIPTLDIGRTLSIKMRAKLESGADYYTNLVRVRATCKDSIVNAENSTTFLARYLPGPVGLEENAFNVTKTKQAELLKWYWGAWNPPAEFGMTSNESDCACLSDAYYDELEKNITKVCCASNYDVP